MVLQLCSPHKMYYGAMCWCLHMLAENTNSICNERNYSRMHADQMQKQLLVHASWR